MIVTCRVFECHVVRAARVNEAWDGGVHAFVLDTVAARPLRQYGAGTKMIEIAAREACAAGC